MMTNWMTSRRVQKKQRIRARSPKLVVVVQEGMVEVGVLGNQVGEEVEEGEEAVGEDEGDGEDGEGGIELHHHTRERRWVEQHETWTSTCSCVHFCVSNKNQLSCVNVSRRLHGPFIRTCSFLL